MVTVSTHPRAVESRAQSTVTPAQAAAILRERTRVGRGAGIRAFIAALGLGIVESPRIFSIACPMTGERHRLTSRAVWGAPKGRLVPTAVAVQSGMSDACTRFVAAVTVGRWLDCVEGVKPFARGGSDDWERDFAQILTGIAGETVDAEIEAYESIGVRAVAGGVQ